MEVSATTNVINAGINRNTSQAADAETQPNAFGIGNANRPEVELSPQARVLQQNDANQQNTRQQASQQRSESNDEQEPPQRNDGFVRVSSSEGSTQKNNLASEKAVEVFQAISRLV